MGGLSVIIHMMRLGLTTEKYDGIGTLQIIGKNQTYLHLSLLSGSWLVEKLTGGNIKSNESSAQSETGGALKAIDRL